MKTYQDLQALGGESERQAFILTAIEEHKSSREYRTAAEAELYYKHRNPTIMRYQKLVYNQFGKAVPDIWSPNNKIASNWFFYFTTQAVQYLLGNGVTFKNAATKKRLGRDFDNRLQKLGGYAKCGGVGFGFWNYDRLSVFALTEFVPLWDEDDGALMAGIRFWQIAPDKPLRATLYELDGYTDYIKRPREELKLLKPKRPYRLTVRSSIADGEEIADGRNYPSFPIVPLWNVERQSDLVGTQNTIDAYDLIASGLVNNVEDGEFIYWILRNCSDMTDEDDARFVEHLKTTHVAHADNLDGTGAEVDAHTVETPIDATERTLGVLANQLYKDFMALKVEDVSAGNVTATQIEAAYEPLNQKTDLFEYQVTDFIQGVLSLAGIDDEPSYTRSQLSNRTELITNVLTSAEYLDDEYVTKKILTLLGDADEADEVLKRRAAESAERYSPDDDEER